MARSAVILLTISVFLLSCKSKQETTTQYYPIGLFLENELKLIDSLKPSITHYYSDNKQTKKGRILFTSFKKIVNELILDNLSKANALNEYEEKTIHDLQLDFLNISYISQENEINTIDVHIDPKNDKVRSVYINKNEFKGDIEITSKILWTSEKQLLINTIYRNKEGVSYKTDRYNWSIMNPK